MGSLTNSLISQRWQPNTGVRGCWVTSKASFGRRERKDNLANDGCWLFTQRPEGNVGPRPGRRCASHPRSNKDRGRGRETNYPGIHQPPNDVIGVLSRLVDAHRSSPELKGGQCKGEGSRHLPTNVSDGWARAGPVYLMLGQRLIWISLSSCQDVDPRAYFIVGPPH